MIAGNMRRYFLDFERRKNLYPLRYSFRISVKQSEERFRTNRNKQKFRKSLVSLISFVLRITIRTSNDEISFVSIGETIRGKISKIISFSSYVRFVLRIMKLNKRNDSGKHAKTSLGSRTKKESPSSPIFFLH